MDKDYSWRCDQIIPHSFGAAPGAGTVCLDDR